jgi:hypothetical protein
LYPRSGKAFQVLIEVEVRTETLLDDARNLRERMDAYPDLKGFRYVRPATDLDDAESRELIEERRAELPSTFEPLQNAADRWHKDEGEFRRCIEQAKAFVDQTAAELDDPSTPPLKRTSIAIKRSLHDLSGCVPYPLTSGWAQGADEEVVERITTKLSEIRQWTEELRLIVQPPHSLASPASFVQGHVHAEQPATFQGDTRSQLAPILAESKAKKKRAALDAGLKKSNVRPAKKRSAKRSALRLTTAHQEKHLTPQQREILAFLRDEGATSFDDRLKADYIAEKRFDAESKRVRDNLAALVREGLVNSAKGRKGGYWITAEGQALLIALGDRVPTETVPSSGASQGAVAEQVAAPSSRSSTR